MSEENKLTDEATIDSLKEMAIKSSNDKFTNRALVSAINLINRLQNDYSNLKERYVKILGLNENVIAEQKEIIEKQVKIYEKLENSYGELIQENAEQKAEIERLTEQHLKLMDEHDEYGNLAVERLIEVEELKAKNAELQKQVNELKEENKELYKENTTLIAGSILERKDIAKDTAKEILTELDLFFKGTTFRQGYEFKKINEKLKEMAKSHGVEVGYEN